jgi:hypothetical protein
MRVKVGAELFAEITNPISLATVSPVKPDAMGDLATLANRIFAARRYPNC